MRIRSAAAQLTTMTPPTTNCTRKCSSRAHGQIGTSVTTYIAMSPPHAIAVATIATRSGMFRRVKLIDSIGWQQAAKPDDEDNHQEHRVAHGNQRPR